MPKAKRTRVDKTEEGWKFFDKTIQKSGWKPPSFEKYCTGGKIRHKYISTREYVSVCTNCGLVGRSPYINYTVKSSGRTGYGTVRIQYDQRSKLSQTLANSLYKNRWNKGISWQPTNKHDRLSQSINPPNTVCSIDYSAPEIPCGSSYDKSNHWATTLHNIFGVTPSIPDREMVIIQRVYDDMLDQEKISIKEPTRADIKRILRSIKQTARPHIIFNPRTVNQDKPKKCPKILTFQQAYQSKWVFIRNVLMGVEVQQIDKTVLNRCTTMFDQMLIAFNECRHVPGCKQIGSLGKTTCHKTTSKTKEKCRYNLPKNNYIIPIFLKILGLYEPYKKLFPPISDTKRKDLDKLMLRMLPFMGISLEEHKGIF